MGSPTASNQAATASQSDQRLIVQSYLDGDSTNPLFLCGDAIECLGNFPDASVDVCMTSPPYWGHRNYEAGGIGGEPSFSEYIDALLAIFGEVKRVLKPTASFWLNVGDTYNKKNLVGIPWRLAIALMDRQGWILRNSIVWYKVKGGPDNAADKLRNVHENVFHFVKRAQGYYYDADAIRSNPRKAQVLNGAIISATGVTGVRYRRQIELSTSLSPAEKVAALRSLEEMMQEIRQDKLADFRMIIRGQQRTTHSDSLNVSGRAKELQQKGFYFLRYHPRGSKPGDVWEILPEDTHSRQGHFAAYPADLCRIPIISSCPPKGLVLDPFAGTGTTMLVAQALARKSIGIELSREYVGEAITRCNTLL